jgi:hypothetical protein
MIRRRISEPDAGRIGSDSLQQHQRIIDRDLWKLHDAGRCDPADHERAVERGRQGDSDDPAGRNRMNQIADVAIAVVIAMSALPPRTDVVSPAGYGR